ncbi:MAG TPA: hypothetical protein VIR29_02535 [Anseongella sp.]
MERYFSSKSFRFSPKTRRKVSVFAFCLFISVILWLFFYLSNEYRYRVSAYIVFINQPAEKAVSIRDSVRATLTVESTGWNYFFRRLHPGILTTDLSSLEDEEAVDLRNFLTSYNRQTSSDQRIVDVNPDTVYFDLVARMEKKVPVIPDVAISYRNQYINYGPVRINPDSVVVSGPVTEVKPIEEIRTVPVRLEDINSSIRRYVPLDRRNKKNIHLDNRSVLLTVPVEEYTENTLKIPVEILNNKDDYEVTRVPSVINVTYYVPLSRYTEVDPEDFRITADLDEWQEKNKNVLTVRLERFPDFIRIVRSKPEIIDFLVYR